MAPSCSRCDQLKRKLLIVSRDTRSGMNWARNLERFCRFRYKLIPVEVLFILFNFLVMFHPQIYKQLFFQRLAEEAVAPNFTDLSNYTTQSSYCLNQDLVVNYTSNATFEKVQRTANHFTMYCEIISLGTGSLVALIYGPLSDIIGRKPILVIGFTGILLAGVVQLCIVVFELNLYFNLLSVGMFGLGGGSATMTGIAFASVSDVTPKKWLAARMGIVESGVSIGMIMSFLIGFNWLQSDHCNFLPPVILMISTSVFCLLYLIIFPEPLSKNKSKQSTNESRGFTKLLNGVKLFFIPSYIGFPNWWRVWVICIVISLESLCETGSDEIINYFLYNKPLEWSYRAISFYGAYFNILNAASLLIICPILIALKLSKYLVILIPIVVAVVCNVVTGFVSKTWEMYVGEPMQIYIVFYYVPCFFYVKLEDF